MVNLLDKFYNKIIPFFNWAENIRPIISDKARYLLDHPESKKYMEEFLIHPGKRDKIVIKCEGKKYKLESVG